MAILSRSNWSCWVKLFFLGGGFRDRENIARLFCVRSSSTLLCLYLSLARCFLALDLLLFVNTILVHLVTGSIVDVTAMLLVTKIMKLITNDDSSYVNDS